MMHNETDRRGRAGGTVTRIAELSHDLVFHRGVLGVIRGHSVWGLFQDNGVHFDKNRRERIGGQGGEFFRKPLT